MKKVKAKVSRQQKTALRKAVRDLDRATRNLIKAGTDLSVLLTPRIASGLHRKLGGAATRVERIAKAAARIR